MMKGTLGGGCCILHMSTFKCSPAQLSYTNSYSEKYYFCHFLHIDVVSLLKNKNTYLLQRQMCCNTKRSTSRPQLTMKTCALSKPTNMKQRAKHCWRWAKNQNVSKRVWKRTERDGRKAETEITYLKALYLLLQQILIHLHSYSELPEALK